MPQEHAKNTKKQVFIQTKVNSDNKPVKSNSTIWTRSKNVVDSPVLNNRNYILINFIFMIVHYYK